MSRPLSAAEGREKEEGQGRTSRANRQPHARSSKVGACARLETNQAAPTHVSRFHASQAKGTEL